MNLSKYKLLLDIHNETPQKAIAVKKLDNSRKIEVTLCENGSEYIIGEGCTAVFRAKKSDGTVLYNNCTIASNRITYELTNQTTSAVGAVECEITLSDANQKQITSPRFVMMVLGTVVSDSEIESEDEFTALQTAINQCNTLNVAVSKSGDIATITLTKKDGTTQTAQISDGEDGADGDDGFSPVVTVTTITGGHRVTITDATGDHVFDVMDGQGGGGTGDHTELTNRDSSDQHPISAITGLSEALAAKGTYTKPSGGIPASDLASGVIPTSLKNPNALTFTGAVSGTYDGSEAKTINIPQGGGSVRHVVEFTPVWDEEAVYDEGYKFTGCDGESSATYAQIVTWISNNEPVIVKFNGPHEEEADCLYLHLEKFEESNEFIWFRGITHGYYGERTLEYRVFISTFGVGGGLSEDVRVKGNTYDEETMTQAVAMDDEGALWTKPIPTSLADLAGDSTHRVVTDAEKTAWGAKYSKPSGGIPASDLASGVIPDVSGKENASNKVTSLSSASTDTQYPTAKCVYDLVGNIESALEALL